MHTLIVYHDLMILYQNNRLMKIHYYENIFSIIKELKRSIKISILLFRVYSL